MIRVPRGELRRHHGMKPVASGNLEEFVWNADENVVGGTAEKTGGNAER